MPTNLIYTLNNKILLESNKLLTNQVINPLVSGYKVFLDAGNSSSYSGSGTNWINLGSATANGTMTNCSYSASGGGSISFNGISSYVNCGSDSSIADFTGMTNSIWLYVTGNTNGLFTYKSDNGNSAGWFVGAGSGVNNRFGISVVNSSADMKYYIDGVAYLPLNQWFNFTTVWKGGLNYSGCSIYINNVLQADLIVTINGSGTHASDAAQPLYIGTKQNTSLYFNGLISNILIYDKVLNTTELTQNYNTQKTRFGL
jgi:hypothetical protein